MDLCTRMTFIAGLSLIVMGCAGAVLPSLDDRTPVQPSLVIATAQEGRSTVVSGKVEYLTDESEGKIKVAIAPYAQLFFIARSDQNFEKWLTLLKQAKDRQDNVKCTVRAYSGRIEHVAVQR